MKRLLFAFFLAAPAVAQTALPDPAAVMLALDDHPAVEAGRARLKAAQAEARGRAAGPHEVIASASIIRRRVDQEGEYAEYDASLTRAIRLPGKASLDRKTGMAGVSVADNMADDARHQAAVSLNDLWWDWAGASLELAVLNRSVATLEAASVAVRRRVALRDASALEADQADNARALARSAAKAAAGRELASRASLAAQFPTLPLPARAPEPPAPELPPEGIDALGVMVVERSHEIGAAVAQADRARLLAERARRDRFADPSIGVRGFSERDGAERGVGLLLSVPLGGAHRRAMAEQSGANALAAEAESLAVRHDLSALASRDVAIASAAYAAWQEAALAAEASASAASKTARGHALGGLDLSDSLYAQRLAQESALAEAVARVAAWRAITRLRIDSHTLWMHQ